MPCGKISRYGGPPPASARALLKAPSASCGEAARSSLQRENIYIDIPSPAAASKAIPSSIHPTQRHFFFISSDPFTTIDSISST
ncbi:MAG: hypothetical protein V3T83_15655, partial [Acidobacteriota bacterium]